MVKPIRPDQVKNVEFFPDFVLEAFNELIQQNFNGSRSIFDQNDAIEMILSKTRLQRKIDDQPELTRATIFKNGWLDIENVYRKEGWKVEFDKPGYNESYIGFWTFTSPSNGE